MECQSQTELGTKTGNSNAINLALFSIKRSAYQHKTDNLTAWFLFV